MKYRAVRNYALVVIRSADALISSITRLRISDRTSMPIRDRIERNTHIPAYQVNIDYHVEYG